MYNPQYNPLTAGPEAVRSVYQQASPGSVLPPAGHPLLNALGNFAGGGGMPAPAAGDPQARLFAMMQADRRG